MCKIKGCAADAVGKGLCAKHYMRARRHGSANTVEKRGRKPNSFKAEFKSTMMGSSAVEWSPRKWERFWLATRILYSAGVGQKKKAQIYASASRPNGSMNVSKLVRDAADIYFDKKDKKSKSKKSKSSRR